MKPIKLFNSVIRLKASNDIEDLNSAPAGANKGLTDLRRNRRKPRALKPKQAPVPEPTSKPNSILDMSTNEVYDMLKNNPASEKNVNFSGPLTEENISGDDDFAQGPLRTVKRLGKGITESRNVKIGNKNYVAKHDAPSVKNEALAHEIGKELTIPIPKTKIKRIPHPKTNRPEAHSLQEMKEGLTGRDINEALGRNDGDLWDRKYIIPEIRNHPDAAKMVLGDYIMGNHDRHDENYLYNEKENKVHPIDHGYAFVPQSNGEGIIKKNIGTMGKDLAIPDDFRQAVLNADPKKHAAIMRKHHQLANQHFASMNGRVHNDHIRGGDAAILANDDVPGYLKRLQTMKKHLSNPKIKTMQDIYNALYGVE